MITVYPYAELGHADHGWLDARHHFSFARYWNPKRTGFGSLLVINDDKVEAGRGFGTHPHDNMEIITYVREGAIMHKDSMGNVGRTEAGDVQVMSAGTGVFHSEHNLEKVDTRLYQIWIVPNEKNVAPRWKAKAFPKTPVEGQLGLLVSGMPQHANKGALYIHQDAAIYGGRLKAGARATQTLKHQGYVLASEGSFTLNGVRMQQGDGAEVTDAAAVEIVAETDAEILVLDVPEREAD
ncbi:MAG: pirin family protein [Rickettsiales bacterium]|nr:pirin family protein [Rickettsiales bacterium]